MFVVREGVGFRVRLGSGTLSSMAAAAFFGGSLMPLPLRELLTQSRRF